MTWLAIATGAQFLILLGIALVVLSLARQIGILHERTAPASLNKSQDHLHAGDLLPEVEVRTLSDERLVLGGTTGGRKDGSKHADGWTSLLFIAADCPICRSVLPAYQLGIDAIGDMHNGYWVGDGMPLSAYEEYAANQNIDAGRLILSQELGLRLGVRALPALALLDADHRVVSVDVVNGPAEVQRRLRQVATPTGENNR